MGVTVELDLGVGVGVIGELSGTVELNVIVAVTAVVAVAVVVVAVVAVAALSGPADCRLRSR